MDWSLLGCGAGGHVTFAPDEPGLRERFGHTTREGQAWRCLRCGAFVIGEPTASGLAEAAPQVRRGTQVRSAFILRVFAVERFIRAVIFAALAIAIWRFSLSRLSLEESYDRALPPLRALLTDLGFSVQHSKVLVLLNKAFTTDPKLLGYLAIGCAAYAAVEFIEGVGLWLVKRWGEYFAMIATSAGLPYEIYDLAHKVTVLRVVAFAINLGLVLYLVLTKRLFGARGGKKAYEALLRSESILDAEIAALAAESQLESEQQAEAGRHAKPEPREAPALATEPDSADGPPWSAAASPAGDPASFTELDRAGEPPRSTAASPDGAPAPGTEPGTVHQPFESAEEPGSAAEPGAVRQPFESAEEPGPATEPVRELFESAKEAGPATEPGSAGGPPWSAAARPAGVPGPATEPVPAGEPASPASAAPLGEPTAEVGGLAAGEVPDAGEADVTALPPLPRRHPPA